jgi:hypothetical protein
MQGDFCEVILIFDSDLSGGRYFYGCIKSRFMVKDKVKAIERRLNVRTRCEPFGSARFPLEVEWQGCWDCRRWSESRRLPANPYPLSCAPCRDASLQDAARSRGALGATQLEAVRRT